MTNKKSQRPYIGVILLLIEDGKLLLQQRCTDDELYHFYAPIAGKVEAFESPSVAVIREAYEEAGIIVDPLDLILACTVHWSDTIRKGKRADIIEFYYLAYRYRHKPTVREPENAMTIDFYPLDDLPLAIAKSIPFVLNAIEQKRHYLEWSGDRDKAC